MEISDQAAQDSLPVGDNIKKDEVVPVKDPSIVHMGDCAILYINKSKYMFVQCTKMSTMRLTYRDTKVALSAIVGHPFGSVFELQNGQLVRIEKVKEIDISLLATTPQEEEDTRDNRNLSIKNSLETQKLTTEEIMKMRQEGHSGEKIIHALVESSTTFKEKTLYSQEKYLKKKQKKYMTMVQVIKPTSYSLCKAYFSKTPKKICSLRIDSLSQILTVGNIYAGQTVITFDETNALLLGSINEKLGGHGKIINVFFPQHPLIGILKYFNFTDKQKSTISHCNLSELSKMFKVLPTEVEQPKPSNEPNPLNIQVNEEINMDIKDNNEGGPEPMQEIASENQPALENESSGVSSIPPTQREERNQKKAEAHNQLKEVLTTGAQSLIVAVKAEPPQPILEALFPFLEASGSFVVFTQYIQHLVPIYQALKNANAALNLQISETWLREYQVLPNRTHPLRNMSGGSGFILTGIKIKGANWGEGAIHLLSKPSQPQTPEGPPKKRLKK